MFGSLIRSWSARRRAFGPPSFRPGLEELGGPPRSARSAWEFRPLLERLEERQVPSTSGFLTSVTDSSGHSIVYGINANGDVLVNLTNTLGGFTPLTSCGCAFTISAGTDAGGSPVVYGVGDDGNVWENVGNSPSGWVQKTFDGSSLDVAGGTQGVYYYNDGGDAWVGDPGGNVQLTFCGCVAVISGGADRNGNNVLYAVGKDGNVYENANLTPNGWAQQTTDGGSFDVSGGVNGLYFYNDSGNTWLGTPSGKTQLTTCACVDQISAGTDNAGNNVLYSLQFLPSENGDELFENATLGVGADVQLSSTGGNLHFVSATGDNQFYALVANSVYYRNSSGAVFQIF